jgi:pantothenate kinase
MNTWSSALATAHLAHLHDLTRHGKRVILGLVGCPGSGKSTLAAALQQAFQGRSQVVPMDGFHLAQCELERLGRAERKGAADTFDSAGYVALLRRLREQSPHEVVYAPEFRREVEEPIAGAIAVLPDTELIITEGNYLLFPLDPWAKIATLLDEIWYVDVNPDLRRQRLAARHEQFGRSPQAALDWVAQTDEPNARLIEATRDRAHRIFDWAGTAA